MKTFPKEDNKNLLLTRSFSNLEEIDLGDISVEKKILHNKLNEKLWDGFELKKDVKDALINIANKFFSFLEIKASVKDVFFTGSLANYNYTEFSDIDVHLVVDYLDVADDYDLVSEFFFAKSSLWELKHDINVKGFPVQMFVEDVVKEERKSSGIFSLSHNKWIKKPSHDNFEIDTNSLKKKIKKFVDKIELLDKHKTSEEGLYKHAKRLKDDINRMRQSGLDKNGEYSIENLTFKYLRNNKYIERLKELISSSFDKIYSL
jgi:hypothetical protein